MTMEYFSQKEKQTLESLEKKPILEWSKNEWKIKNTTHDINVIDQLSKMKGQTIYTILRRISADGMNRVIDMFFVENNQPIHIHFGTSRIFQKRYQTSNGFGYKVSGCGMDMGFHLVQSLSYTICRYLNQELDGYFFKQEWF